MEIRNLTTFLKVAELKHFTQAAEQLGYVQSTITTQIQQLESEIGLPLFDRIGKKVILTTTGEELIVYANQIVGLCDQVREVGKVDCEVRGVLRIGVVESLYVACIEPMILLYRTRFPFVHITIRLGSGRDLMSDLGKNELDLIFILDHNLSEKDLTPVLTQQEPVVFVANSTHALCKETNISLSKVMKEPLVLTESDSIYRVELERLALQQSIEVKPAIEANNTSAIVRLVEQGAGITFLPRCVVERSVVQGNLSILNTQLDDTVEFWRQLLHHKNKWISRPMQGFIDLLRAQLKKNE